MTTHNVLPPTENSLRKAKRGRCSTPHCRRTARQGRNICNTCRDRKWRAAHPEHHLWKNLKKSAKKRGVPFSLTVDEFKAFCARTRYHELVGRNAMAASCDRIDDTKGYSADNIRCLEYGLNAGRPKERGRTATDELPLQLATAGHYEPHEDPLAT